MIYYSGITTVNKCYAQFYSGTKRGKSIIKGFSIMQEFYYKDKNKNFSIMGIAPHNDVDWPPYDYFRFGYAKNISMVFGEKLKYKCPVIIPKEKVKKFCFEKTDEMLKEKLESSKPNAALHELLTNDTLTKKEQEKLLIGKTFNACDLLWLNKDAQDLGYLLDVYHEEKYPDKFKEKQHSVCYRQKEDCEMETIGDTNMTDGEMRALLEQRKVVQARIYHKGNIWHCFYFTFKGLNGLESGMMGSKPHYHYLSDKSGITWEGLIDCIKRCDMPRSKVHVVIDRNK